MKDFHDPENWPDGPWVGEPSEDEWFDVASGFKCQARRNPLGAWCGYVGVPRGHVFFGVSDDEVIYSLDVHGGVTFTGKWEEYDPLWWFGFDCCHAWDITPGMFALEMEMDFPTPGEAVYRDLKYVKRECKKLASQLRTVQKEFSVDRKEAIEWLLQMKNKMNTE